MKLINKKITDIQNLYRERSSILKAMNQPKIGWMSVSTPEEIIHAAELVPFRILGDTNNYKTESATALLGNNVCSHLLSCLGEGVSGTYDYADGIIFDDSCDERKRLYENWVRSIDINYGYQLEIPKQINKISRDYYRNQYKQLIKSLEDQYGCQITDEKLLKSISLFNKTRTLLQKLDVMRSKGEIELSSNQMISIVKAACSGQQLNFNNELQELFNIIKTHSRTVKINHRDDHKVMICGGFFDNKPILNALERPGVRVMYEDTSTGSHYYSGTIKANGDPINSIADFYLDRAAGGAMIDIDKRINKILDIISKYEIDSVIYFPMKFCDRYLFNFPYFKEVLKEKGVNVMNIESEVHVENIENIKTRIETFIEMQMF